MTEVQTAFAQAGHMTLGNTVSASETHPDAQPGGDIFSAVRHGDLERVRYLVRHYCSAIKDSSALLHKLKTGLDSYL